jgi:hypothetical protein
MGFLQPIRASAAVLSILTAGFTSLAVVSLAAAAPAFADTNQCPSSGTGNPPVDNQVGASFTVSGNTASYTFSSFVNENPSGGIPGLIAYCVYPSNPVALPDSTTVTAVGQNGAQWVDPPQPDNFSFQRPDGGGNNDNINLDGTQNIAMGTATWNSGAPASEFILLHINDPDECAALGLSSSTCFVLPGTGVAQNQDLTVSKTATPSFTRSYTWGISKSVDHTLFEQIGGTVTANYTVNVTHDTGTDGNWKVAGDITVTNPNSAEFSGVNVTDDDSADGGTCSVTGGTGATISANSSADFPYTCTYSSNPGSATDTATVTWDQATYNTPDGSATGTANADFSSVNPTITDGSVDVSDSAAGDLGTVSYTDPSPTAFTYSRTFNVPTWNCSTYDNTATFTTSDTGTTGSASASVKVCGPAKTGALTIGFWKTTNGQNLIKTYCTSSSGSLGTYLAGLGAGSGPFSNAPTGCSSLASYVSTILAGASASNMNSMLKAQMLGTSLDVWFSGPGWTSTAKSGIKPPSNFLSHNSLGSFNMDTTAVCPMVDNLSTGTATCQNNTPSTDAVQAGAVPTSPMSIQAILNYAATTPSPFNGLTSGSVWYGGNKTKEEVLKNIFDQFNNQLAFGSF